MEKEKLLTLASFLRDVVKDDEFYMKIWAERLWPDKKCGTTACAVGWATACFPDSGLTLITLGNPESSVLVPEFQGKTGYEAAALFFGLTIDDAVFLFCPSRHLDHQSRMDVVTRIERFCSEH